MTVEWEVVITEGKLVNDVLCFSACMKCHLDYKNEFSMVLKTISHNHDTNRDRNELLIDSCF